MTPPTHLTRRVPSILIGAALVLWSFAAGIVFAMVGVSYGAAFMLAGAVLVAIAVASFRYPLLPAALVVACLPAGDVRLPGGLRLIELAAFCAFALMVVVRAGLRRTVIVWTPQHWWLVGIVAAYVVSAAGALDAGAATYELVLLASGVLFAVTVVSSCDGSRDVQRLVAVFCTVAAAMCAYGMTAFTQLQAVRGGNAVQGRATGVFSQPNQMGSFAAMALLAAIGLAFSARSRRGRAAATVLVLLGLGGLVASLSRGAWIGAGLGLVGFAILVPTARRHLVLAVVILAAAVAAAVASPDTTQVAAVKDRIQTLRDPADNPYDDRPAIFAEAAREIQARPAFGFGPGAFPTASAKAVSRARTVEADHAHNALLTIGAEAGLVAVAVVVGFTISLARLGWRCTHHLGDGSQASVAGGVAAALLTLVGHGLVDFTLPTPIIAVTAFALIGLLMGASTHIGRPADDDPAVAEHEHAAVAP
ncbi:MAG: O-antigen ligase family protein [Acidimicrobiia bacterium]|nr:O-antigen ligase family protein [Acidimicrobiia bacterium]